MMSVKVLVFLVTVLAATTVSAASSDPVMWLWERAWPKAQPEHQAPPVVVAPEVEAKPLPRPRPKVEAKPKVPPKPKARPAASKKSLPSCSAVKREYERMSYAQQWSAYRRASAEEVAHGRRCLGF